MTEHIEPLSEAQKAAVRRSLADRDRTIRDAAEVIKRLYQDLAFACAVLTFVLASVAGTNAARAFSAAAEGRTAAAWFAFIISAGTMAGALWTSRRARESKRWAEFYESAQQSKEEKA